MSLEKRRPAILQKTPASPTRMGAPCSPRPCSGLVMALASTGRFWSAPKAAESLLKSFKSWFILPDGRAEARLRLSRSERVVRPIHLPKAQRAGIGQGPHLFSYLKFCSLTQVFVARKV